MDSEICDHLIQGIGQLRKSAMDKTLETVTVVYRLIIVVALTLFVVGVSAYRPSGLYDQAAVELEGLENSILAVSEQVSDAYKAIYDKSELKASTLAWLRQRKAQQKTVNVEVISPNELAIPDPNQNSLVTLEEQVKWADRAYRDLGSMFFLCAVDRRHVFRALDKLFTTTSKPNIKQLRVYVLEAKTAPGRNQRFQCEVELEYEVRVETMIGLRTAMLDLPSTVVNVTLVEPPGPKWIDLEVANTLKENGLGDYEDAYYLVIPGLRELWTDLGHLPPEAARAFLEQKKNDEAEKAKEKIEILGKSLNASLTIILAIVVELFLMVYLLVHLIQIRILLPGNEKGISASPFFGIMCSSLGQLVMLSTLLVIPFGVCIFVGIAVFPPIQRGWSSVGWDVFLAARWALVSVIGLIGLGLIRHVYAISKLARV